MSEILIIGCGYLGRRLAAHCIAEGRRVFATTRSRDRAQEFRAAGIEPIVCDVTDPAGLTQLPAVETVVHCIGLDRSAGKPMRAVYVEGLRNVLASLPAPLRFLYVSSTSVYGQRDGDVVDETSATEPAEESGRIVLEAESVLRASCPGAVVLRFAAIYGPGRLLRAQTIRAGEPIVGDPDRWLNLIHVDDGVRAVLAAEHHPVDGLICNICDGFPVLRREFYARLAELLNAPPPQFVLPEPGSTPPSHELANRRIVNRRMHEELGVALRFPTFEEGLRVSVESV